MNGKSLLAIALLSLSAWAGIGHCGDATPARKGKTLGAAPEFTEVTDWVNSKPLKMVDLKGKVVVVHFWTNGCINCVHNYPYYRAWTEKYKGNKDLVIVGIHTPEFDAEKNIDRIKARAAKNHLTFPIAVDNEQSNWKAWGNRYWPCVYVVDKTGNIRQRWEGELRKDGFKAVTEQIDNLLDEPSPNTK
jgi:peroxiredoxin